MDSDKRLTEDDFTAPLDGWVPDTRVLRDKMTDEQLLDARAYAQREEDACSTSVDTRNLRDEYKGLSNEQVFDELEKKRSALEVAIENVEHDFNAGTIVRSANNFNVAKVHIIGRKKYNRRGAMCTDKYLEVVYWASAEEFLADQRARGREVVAIENNVPKEILQARVEGSARDSELGRDREDFTGVKGLVNKKFVQRTTLVFGSEGNGISAELLGKVDDIREIESLGSTRSVNVGVAAGIAMYEWARQCALRGGDEQ